MYTLNINGKNILKLATKDIIVFGKFLPNKILIKNPKKGIIGNNIKKIEFIDINNSLMRHTRIL
ncbi:MAG: hypothetical protein ACQPRJ_00280 [Solitalea-like symbiont of Acarus siro]